MTAKAIQDAPDTVEVHGEKSLGGKLAIFVSILKRWLVSRVRLTNRLIGVKDINAIRFSLPSQLVEPIGNIEYSPLLVNSYLGIGIIWTGPTTL